MSKPKAFTRKKLASMLNDPNLGDNKARGLAKKLGVSHVCIYNWMNELGVKLIKRYE